MIECRAAAAVSSSCAPLRLDHREHAGSRLFPCGKPTKALVEQLDRGRTRRLRYLGALQRSHFVCPQRVLKQVEEAFTRPFPRKLRYLTIVARSTIWRRGGDSNPRCRFTPHNRLATRVATYPRGPRGSSPSDDKRNTED
jgi:hypothetical protein